jgi:hypothetical protein
MGETVARRRSSNRREKNLLTSGNSPRTDALRALESATNKCFGAKLADNQAVGRGLTLSGVLEQLLHQTEGERVSIGELLNAFGLRAYGPVLLILAIIVISPIGAIPGFSVLIGALICVVAVQLLALQDRPWVPRRLEAFSFPRKKLSKAVAALRPYTARVDKLLKPRLEFFMAPPFAQIIAAACLVMALLMFPFALVPFAVLLPGLAVGILGLGLAARDGILILSGLILSLAGLAAGVGWALGAL